MLVFSRCDARRRIQATRHGLGPALLVALAIVGVVAPMGAAQEFASREFEDVPRGHWAYGDLHALRGPLAPLMLGLRPGAGLTRYEFAVFVARAMDAVSWHPGPDGRYVPSLESYQSARAGQPPTKLQAAALRRLLIEFRDEPAMRAAPDPAALITALDRVISQKPPDPARSAETGEAVRAKAAPGPLKSWRLAFVRRGDIWIANGDGTGQRVLIRNASSPCWSPDRKQIAFARHGNVWVADSDGRGARQLTSRRQQGPSRPEGGRYTGGRDVTISWDARDDVITFSHWERFSVARLGSRDARVIAGCSIYDVPAASRRPQSAKARFDIFDDEARFHPSANDCPAWSRSGQRLAFVRNGDVWIAERSETPGRTAAPGKRVPPSTWGWDVTRLEAAARYDAPTDRGSRMNLFVTHLSWSPDGKSIAYGRRRLDGSGVWEVFVRKVRQRGGSFLPDSASKLADGQDPCFSPDGKWIAYHGEGEGGLADIIALPLAGGQARRIVANGSQPAW